MFIFSTTLFYINYSNKDTITEINYYKNIIKKEQEKEELNNYYIVKLEDICNINNKINDLLIQEAELKTLINNKNSEKNNLEIKINNLVN